VTLGPGESITLYTDGVTEARNKAGDFYGEERLINLMNGKDYNCLVEIHHSIKDDMAKFVDGADQSDDITLLTLQYKGDECFYEEKFFEGKMENVQTGLEFVESFCDAQGINMEFKNSLMVVADEIYSNIVKYGYKQSGGDVFTRLFYNKDKQEFVMTIIDKAPAFNQLDINNAPIEGDVSDRPVGGLGILIVKKIMTEYAYDRINNKNILVLKKKF
jgi:sigma-B regulation protein RsbU (phosphoserine phosphatase)